MVLSSSVDELNAIGLSLLTATMARIPFFFYQLARIALVAVQEFCGCSPLRKIRSYQILPFSGKAKMLFVN